MLGFATIRIFFSLVLLVLSPEDGESTPAALRELLVRLLTVDGQGKRFNLLLVELLYGN